MCMYVCINPFLTIFKDMAGVGDKKRDKETEVLK